MQQYTAYISFTEKENPSIIELVCLFVFTEGRNTPPRTQSVYIIAFLDFWLAPYSHVISNLISRVFSFFQDGGWRWEDLGKGWIT